MPRKANLHPPKKKKQKKAKAKKHRAKPPSAYRCGLCGRFFTRRYSVENHFPGCVRRKGNPLKLPWDQDPSCWRRGRDGPGPWPGSESGLGAWSSEALGVGADGWMMGGGDDDDDDAEGETDDEIVVGGFHHNVMARRMLDEREEEQEGGGGGGEESSDEDDEEDDGYETMPSSPLPPPLNVLPASAFERVAERSSSFCEERDARFEGRAFTPPPWPPPPPTPRTLRTFTVMCMASRVIQISKDHASLGVDEMVAVGQVWRDMNPVTPSLEQCQDNHELMQSPEARCVHLGRYANRVLASRIQEADEDNDRLLALVSALRDVAVFLNAVDVVIRIHDLVIEELGDEGPLLL